MAAEIKKPIPLGKNIDRLARMTLPTVISGKMLKMARGKTLFGSIAGGWAMRDISADPETMEIVWKDGDVIKGTINIQKCTVTPAEAGKPHAFKVTGHDADGNTTELVMAAKDETEGHMWIDALKKLGSAKTIKDAQAQAQEYQDQLTAWKTWKNESRAKRTVNLLPKQQGQEGFSEADEILRLAVNNFAKEKFVQEGGKSAVQTKHDVKMHTTLPGGGAPPPPPGGGALPPPPAASKDFDVDLTGAKKVIKTDKFEGAELGTAMEDLPVNEHTIEISATVDDVHTAVKVAQQEHREDVAKRRQEEEEKKRKEEEELKAKMEGQEQIRIKRVDQTGKEETSAKTRQEELDKNFEENKIYTIQQERVRQKLKEGEESSVADVLLTKLQEKAQKLPPGTVPKGNGKVEYDVTVGASAAEQEKALAKPDNEVNLPDPEEIAEPDGEDWM